MFPKRRMAHGSPAPEARIPKSATGSPSGRFRERPLDRRRRFGKQQRKREGKDAHSKRMPANGRAKLLTKFGHNRPTRRVLRPAAPRGSISAMPPLSMKTDYVLVDFENVQPKNLNLLDCPSFHVFVFVGESQTKFSRPVVLAMQKFGDRAQYVEISGSGHNALDFHIAYFIGKISSEVPESAFHIVSKDCGFDSLVAFLKNRNVSCERVESVEKIKISGSAEMANGELFAQVEFVKKKLSAAGATHPRSRQTLSSHVNALFSKKLTEDRINAIVESLFRQGFVRANGTRLVYELRA